MRRRIPALVTVILFLPMTACDQEIPTEVVPAAQETTNAEEFVFGREAPARDLGSLAPDVESLYSVVPGSLGPQWLQITPQSPTVVTNCIPFGSNRGRFSGFIYRNVPPFELTAGMKFGFDLGSPNDLDIRRDIFFAVANKNPGPASVSGNNVVSQGIEAVEWLQVVSEEQIPENPRGNSTIGDYELRYTAEANFVFPGGGLIVGFSGVPPATYLDSTCDQVLVATTSVDASDQFYSRFFNKPHLHDGSLDDLTGGGSAVALGGIIIERAQNVAFDIRPASCPNPLNVNSRGVIPTAILGEVDFDVSEVDPETVVLNGVPALRWSFEDAGTPYAGEPIEESDCTGDGPDGFDDLTFKFDTRALVAALGPVTDREVVVLELTGELRDGTAIQGRDVVRIISKR